MSSNDGDRLFRRMLSAVRTVAFPFGADAPLRPLSKLTAWQETLSKPRALGFRPMHERILPLAVPSRRELPDERLPVWVCGSVVLGFSAGCYWFLFRLIAALW